MSNTDPAIRNRGRGYEIGNEVKGDGEEKRRGRMEFISRSTTKFSSVMTYESTRGTNAYMLEYKGIKIRYV